MRKPRAKETKRRKQRAHKGEIIEFNGERFYRYPDGKGSAARYFQPHQHARERGIQALHQEIWKSIHGPIPEGYDVHHADSDTLNNAPENLECISEAEHTARHLEQQQKRGGSANQLALLDVIRPLAAAWHGSEEGKAWHSEHSKQIWADREPRAFTCEYCGKTGFSKTLHQRFCDGTCRQRQANGFQNFQAQSRQCVVCGTTFNPANYNQKYCTRPCKEHHAASRKASRL